MKEKFKFKSKRSRNQEPLAQLKTALTEWGLVLVFLYPLASEHISLLTPEQGEQKGASSSRPTSFLTRNSSIVTLHLFLPRQQQNTTQFLVSYNQIRARTARGDTSLNPQILRWLKRKKVIISLVFPTVKPTLWKNTPETIVCKFFLHSEMKKKKKNLSK